MKSNVVFLAAACAGTLIVAGCTSDQDEPPVTTSKFYTPAVKPAAKPTVQKKAEVQTATVEEFDIAPAAEVKKTPAAKPAAKSAVKPAAKSAAKGEFETIYVVQSGDTLGGIAYRHHLTPAALASYNGISLNRNIYIGQKIRVPKIKGAPAPKPAPVKVAAKTSGKKTSAAPSAGEIVYEIKSGDTLGGIAYRHHVRVKEIEARNGLTGQSILRIGQKLIIPASNGKSAGKVKSAGKKKTAASAENKPVATTTAPAPVATETTGVKPEGGMTEPAVEPAPAPAAADASGVSSTDTVGFCCTQDMTLQEVAESTGRDFERLKKLNPSLSTTEKLKAGTTVQIYIF